ncbi:MULTISPECIES: DUF6597 domain-containing transcriptional factor [unclassified Microbacterium]|uniref:DUF6597 domain-containing transcriptional factor n=1 Tax=unclassified Microbacterium TaxID=2609290 RepID=UPI00364601C2
MGRKPAPPLDRYADDVYCLFGDPGHRRRLLVPPMPSAHLMINLGAPIVLHDPTGERPPETLVDAWFLGIWTRRYVIEYGREVNVVGVHLKPWGLAPFVTAPMGELRDRCVPADGLWGSSLSELRDQLAEATSTSALIGLLETELLSRLTESTADERDPAQQAARRIESSWGSGTVAALTSDTGLSSNRLASRFTSMVGVTPKRLARIYRFARVVLSVDAAAPPAWADLAQTVGYFDQPHLINEFRDFTGRTPTDYLALRRRVPPDPAFPPDMGPMPAE